MGKHRAEVRPRYGRIAVLGSSVAVTLIAVLGGTGLLPSTTGDASARGPADQVTEVLAGTAQTSPSDLSDDGAGEQSDELTSELRSETEAETKASDNEQLAANEAERQRKNTALPADSGEGRRVIFSESRQRVWLVNDAEKVVRTYLVSGSIYDNLDPGTFEVYSRSEDATGIDNSGTMKYFVRFTQGDTGAAIGFHDIPVLDGERIQTFAELGTPLSHGCIRQRRGDALALWNFAPLGTTVVVTP